jgi:hypothetical protein
MLRGIIHWNIRIRTKHIKNNYGTIVFTMADRLKGYPYNCSIHTHFSLNPDNVVQIHCTGSTWIHGLTGSSITIPIFSWIRAMAIYFFCRVFHQRPDILALVTSSLKEPRRRKCLITSERID